MNSEVVVLVDTNMLIMMAKGIVSTSHFDLTLDFRYKLVTTRAVIRELEKLASAGGGKAVGRAASRALRLLDELGVEVVEALAEDADDSIEEAAFRLKSGGARVLVATSDRSLRRRLRLHGIPTLYYRRSKGLLEAEWEII